MYRPPLSKTDSIKPILCKLDSDGWFEFSDAWNRGEIIPINADQASSCFEFSESLTRFKRKILVT